MITLYLQSAAVSLATALPLLIVYERFAAPHEVGFALLAASAAAGALSWLGCLFLVRHPARHEVIGFAETAWSALPRPARSS
jgi:hypothetical protein